MKTHTKVALAVPVIAGLVGGVGVGVIVNAPPAKATTSTHGSMDDHSSYAYMLELNDVGIPGTSSEAGHLAVTVCGERAQGVPEDVLIDGLKKRGVIDGVVVTYSVAIAVVMGAEFHFCSDYEEA
jgi:hypothetical protein